MKKMRNLTFLFFSACKSPCHGLISKKNQQIHIKGNYYGITRDAQISTRTVPMLLVHQQQRTDFSPSSLAVHELVQKLIFFAFKQ